MYQPKRGHFCLIHTKEGWHLLRVVAVNQGRTTEAGTHVITHACIEQNWRGGAADAVKGNRIETFKTRKPEEDFDVPLAPVMTLSTHADADLGHLADGRAFGSAGEVRDAILAEVAVESIL